MNAGRNVVGQYVMGQDMVGQDSENGAGTTTRREAGMRVERLDHLVLTVTDVAATVDFYTRVCGMSHVTFGEGRHGLTFGDQRINLHVWGSEFEPRAALATPGSADLCLLVDAGPEEIADRLGELQVAVEQGPVRRTGAAGPIISFYLRDPDGNLVELSHPAESESTEQVHAGKGAGTVQAGAPKPGDRSGADPALR